MFVGQLLFYSENWPIASFLWWSLLLCCHVNFFTSYATLLLRCIFWYSTVMIVVSSRTVFLFLILYHVACEALWFVARHRNLLFFSLRRLFLCIVKNHDFVDVFFYLRHALFSQGWVFLAMTPLCPLKFWYLLDHVTSCSGVYCSTSLLSNCLSYAHTFVYNITARHLCLK